MAKQATGVTPDKRQQFIGLVGNPQRRYVPVTISLKPAVKSELDAFAAKRSKGAWRGAVKYSDLIREGIELVLVKERAREEAEGKKSSWAAKAAPKKRRGAKR
jgi:hypothetical protein